MSHLAMFGWLFLGMVLGRWIHVRAARRWSLLADLDSASPGRALMAKQKLPRPLLRLCCAHRWRLNSHNRLIDVCQIPPDAARDLEYSGSSCFLCGHVLLPKH